MEIKSLDDLGKIAFLLSKYIQKGDVISLKGDLGAGKTTLVQFFGKHFGIDEYITSPTFSIVNIYQGKMPVYHLDLYRLENSFELEALDYETYIYPDGVSFIEWAEKGEDYIPDDIIEIEITKDGEIRHLQIRGNSNRALELGERINEDFSR